MKDKLKPIIISIMVLLFVSSSICFTYNCMNVRPPNYKAYIVKAIVNSVEYDNGTYSITYNDGNHNHLINVRDNELIINKYEIDDPYISIRYIIGSPENNYIKLILPKGYKIQ